MIFSVGVVILVMALTVGFSGLCTWNPGAPEQGPVQEVDAETFTQLEARSMNFPVRMPQAPEDWVTNSARRGSVEQTPATIVGWVTADGGYLQLTQTGIELDDAVRGYDPDPRELERTETIAGQDIEVYVSAEDEVRDLWALDLGDARALVSGAGTDAEFQTLFEAVIAAEPLAVD